MKDWAQTEGNHSNLIFVVRLSSKSLKRHEVDEIATQFLPPTYFRRGDEEAVVWNESFLPQSKNMTVYAYTFPDSSLSRGPLESLSLNSKISFSSTLIQFERNPFYGETDRAAVTSADREFLFHLLQNEKIALASWAIFTPGIPSGFDTEGGLVISVAAQGGDLESLQLYLRPSERYK